MIELLKVIRRFVRRQIGNAGRLMRGRKLLLPSMGSMTLEADDAGLAKQLLANSDNWFDAGIAEKLHREFGRWNGSEHVFSFMGGRVALSACLFGLDLQPGDEVILPGYTCVVVPNAIRFAGLNPVFADIELETYGLDIEDVKKKTTGRTRAIVVQHLFGLVSKDIDGLLSWAARNNIRVIEDCAQSTGASYKGRKIGNLGDAAFFSCEQSKVFNVVQGGIATTKDPAIAARIQDYYQAAPFPSAEDIERQLKTHLLNYLIFKNRCRWLSADWHNYRLKKYRIISTTRTEIDGNMPDYYGRKMPGAIASLALNQLSKIDRFNQIRRKNAVRWNDWCDGSGYNKPVVIEDSEPVYLRYPVLVEPARKGNLTWADKELGVRPGVWFVSNVHPAETTVTDCPRADEAVKRCINLPTILA